MRKRPLRLWCRALVVVIAVVAGAGCDWQMRLGAPDHSNVTSDGGADGNNVAACK